MALVHVVGAGLAGLSAAVELASQGYRVRLYEAADQAGGRCRSYHDAKLGRIIDNGNHLLLSGNRAALAYLDRIGARASLIGPDRAHFCFYDDRSGERWSVIPGAGRPPWWLFDAERRVAGTTPWDYLSMLALLGARRHHSVTDRLRPKGLLWERFWEPLAVAALNTPPHEAAAVLLRRVLSETFLKGEASCRPLIAGVSLNASLVAPAIAYLRARDGELLLNRRVRSLTFQGDRVRALWLAEGETMLGDGDGLILALPPWNATDLLPGLAVPERHHAIVNAHILLPEGLTPRTPPPADSPMMGLIGTTAQWLFLRQRVISLTVSAADDLAQQPNLRLARLFWEESCRALGLPAGPPPPIRIIKERRATFAQTPAALAKRPATRTRWRNLTLAGDWVEGPYPATIEAAVGSGQRAARIVATQLK